MGKSEAKIKLERTEATLKELIPEALATLNDERIRGMAVVDVVCSKGRDNCKVYLDRAFIEESEIGEILSQLRKAKGVIEGYCATEQGWYRSPKLSFHFDELLQQENRMDKLFKIVEKELHGKN
jgi:ribosome-binding factor A